MPCPNTVLQNDQRLLRQTFILSIDLIVFAPDARSRRSTALRFAAAGVLSRRARTRHSRSATGRMCAACLVPVRVLFGRLKAPSQRSKWKSSDRCNGRDRPQVSQRNAPPPNRAGRRGQVTGCLYACSLYAPVLYHQSSEIGVPVSHTRMRIDQPRKRNQMPPIRIRMPNPPDTIPRTGEIDAVVR